ncbi:MAG: exodeoxyribonuclease III [Leptospirillum sp.]
MEPDNTRHSIEKAATWNVNSLKVRLPQVLDWLAREKPDVACLQETKTPDGQFPLQAFHSIGYEVVFAGQPAYNGVAILSKFPIESPETGMDASEDDHRRFLSARIQGVQVINVYVPNGQDLDSPKFSYKLEWLDRLGHYLDRFAPERVPGVLMGDFNIVPGDLDTWDPDGTRDQIFHSEPERNGLRSLFSRGFIDLYRKIHPDTQAFSWWDYRMGSFHRNRGLRIDLVLATAPLAKRCLDVTIDRQIRKNDRPSDHVPVTAFFTA